MEQMDDFELLADYGRRGSEAAFAALTERYVRLVYCAALRQVRDPHQAEEVTQVVFVLAGEEGAHALREGVILFRLAAAAPAGSPPPISSSANTAASGANRKPCKCKRLLHLPPTIPPGNTSPRSWTKPCPRLGEKDRNVLALRFFEQKSLEEVGAALGIDTSAAQKRVWRAVDKLRQYFARHGAAFSAATITTTLSAHALHAVPSGLTATVAATAALKGTAATASTATLLKTTLKLMAWTKAKIAATAVVFFKRSGDGLCNKPASFPGAYLARDLIKKIFRKAYVDSYSVHCVSLMCHQYGE